MRHKLKPRTYKPRPGTAAEKMLAILASMKEGQAMGSKELLSRAGGGITATKAFLDRAIKAGFVIQVTGEGHGMGMFWMATPAYRQHLKDESQRVIEPRKRKHPKIEKPCKRSLTRWQPVQGHKDPYELETMIRGAFEAQSDRQKFAAAMEDLYKAAGIPLISVRLAA